MYEGRSHSARTGWTAFAVAATLAVGCASPGPPRAPSLRLPAPAEKLEARRVGETVEVSWQTPDKTTDGDKIRGKVTAVVCRETAESGKAAGCDPVGHVTASAGASAMVETLPVELRSGPVKLLSYRVELLNDRGRSEGRSEAVFAAGGEAPPPVGPLTISARREALLIRWQPQKFVAVVELTRKLVTTDKGPVSSRGSAMGKTSSVSARPAGALKGEAVPPFGGARPVAAEVTLSVAGAGGDPGGTLDESVRDGDSYVYVAQRVKKVTLEGHMLELRGVASPASTFVYRDEFPPQAPVGLVSAPVGGFGTVLSIDLSWEPGAEADLLGYNVYRRGGVGEFMRLNAEPITAAAYRDLKVVAGESYAYRVTAVDKRHNESAPSEEIHESLRK